MRIDPNRPYAIGAKKVTSTERVMWISPDRVFYVGLLGTPSTRNYGAIMVYVALEGAVRVQIGTQAWQEGHVFVLPPHTTHRIACESRHIAALMVEPESVDMLALPDWLRSQRGLVERDDLRARVHHAHEALLHNGQQAQAPMLDFDTLLFGMHLPTRQLDKRIAQVVERIRADPSGQALAQDCAEQVHLSFSRFLHLFKSEVGTSFRTFRTWKRARSLLHYVVDQNSTLTDVALGAGYPDSTHFSHSIRQVYGLKPKDIFAGSRKLRVIGTALNSPYGR